MRETLSTPAPSSNSSNSAPLVYFGHPSCTSAGTKFKNKAPAKRYDYTLPFKKLLKTHPDGYIEVDKLKNKFDRM